MENHLNNVWRDSPETVRAYYDRLPTHQRLCDEVKYILERKIRQAKIEFGNISSRAKTLSSFCEKISRKSYLKPLEEITDLSGVRVVYLYASDKKHLEKIIEGEFEVVEKEDKIDAVEFEKFGYGALHYIVSLKEQHAGARYDDLRGVRCEIQIRTILQDAWAIVAHHLSYKNESDIPNVLKRKLNALSGLFETADAQFEQLHLARIEYQESIKNSMAIDLKSSLDYEINLDNLVAYMSWKFPDRRLSPIDSVAELLSELNQFGYTTLKNIDEAVNTALDAMLASEEKSPPLDEDDEPTPYYGVGLIRGVMGFTNEKYLISRSGSHFANAVAEFRHLLK